MNLNLRRTLNQISSSLITLISAPLRGFVDWVDRLILTHTLRQSQKRCVALRSKTIVQSYQQPKRHVLVSRIQTLVLKIHLNLLVYRLQLILCLLSSRRKSLRNLGNSWLNSLRTGTTTQRSTNDSSSE